MERFYIRFPIEVDQHAPRELIIGSARRELARQGGELLPGPWVLVEDPYAEVTDQVTYMLPAARVPT